MLITGGSKGIGRALSEAFAEEYFVLTASRTEGDFVGDLTNQKFRNELVAKVDPFVVINCAGVFPNPETLIESMQINLIALMDLTITLMKKMKNGYVFNISSVSGSAVAPPNLTGITYAIAKKAVSDFSHVVQLNNKSKVKVCTLEPGFVMTDMANIKNRYHSKDPEEHIIKNGIVPFDPVYLAGVIRWIIQQPSDVVISQMRIMNSRSMY